MADTPFLSYSRKYWALDMAVVPIGKNKKYPIVENWLELFKDAYTHDKAGQDRVAKYFAESGIGLLCGEHSGILAVDVDTDDPAFDWIDSPVVKVGKSNRRTVFFQYDGETNGKYFNCVDILSTGKQTVLPPTRYPKTAHTYEWNSEKELLDIHPEDLPIFDLDRLASMDVESLAVENVSAEYNGDTWAKYMQEFANNGWEYTEGSSGNRHDKLLCFVKFVLKDRFDQSDDDSLEDALEANKLNVPKLAEREVEYIVRSAYKKRWKTSAPNVSTLTGVLESASDEDFTGAWDSGSISGKIKEWGFEENIKISSMPISFDAYAERVRVRFGDKIHLDPKLGLYIWSGKVWVHFDTALPIIHHWIKEVKYYSLFEPQVTNLPAFITNAGAVNIREFDKFKRSLFSPNFTSSIIKAIEQDISFYNADVVLDDNPYLFNTPDGCLDLDTLELTDNYPESYCSKISGPLYNSDDSGELWDSFIARIMGNDETMIDYLQRIAGYCLFGHNDSQKWFFFWGEGSNGKTCFLEVLAAVFGEYACAVDSDVFLRTTNTNPNFVWSALAKLQGKRLAIASEVPSDALWNERILKELTGQGQIQTKYMGKDAFEFRPEVRLIIAGNHQPRSEDNSVGFWRRMVLVPFIESIPESEQIEGLNRQLIKECSSYILEWCLEGFKKYRSEGLCVPDKVINATEEYKLNSDPVKLFIHECCESVENYKSGMACREILGALNEFIENNRDRLGIKTRNRFTTTALGRRLKLLGHKNNNKGKKYSIALKEDYIESAKSNIIKVLDV